MRIRYVLSAFVLGLGLMVVLLLSLTQPVLPVRAHPGIYYVREGGTGTTCTDPANPCGSIQQGIDQVIFDGDEVWVSTGTYAENLVIEHSVILRGGWDTAFSVQSPGSTPTVVDGGSAHNVRVENAPLAKVTLEGLTLRNGRDGIHIWTGQVTVENCTILDSEKQGFEIDGGTVLISATHVLTTQQGIEVDAGTVQVANVHVAHTIEEGVLIEGGGIVTFTGSIIEDCQQQGVQLDQGRLWLFDNLIRDINADGIRIESGAVSIISNTVHTIASDGVDVSGTHTIRGNVIYATVRRGIYAHDGTLTIRDNTVDNTGGDGIRTDDGLIVTIRGNTVTRSNNDGIDARGDHVAVTYNTVSGCADNGIKIEGNGHAHIDANWVLSNAVGLAVQGASAFTATNNVVGDHITASAELTGTGTGILYHNTLVGSGTGTQGTGLVVPDPLTTTLVNNIVVSHSVGISTTSGATTIVSHTLLWGNGDDPVSGTVVIPFPPLFVAPAQQDYHLLADSPAVDAGIDVSVASDVDGDPRLGPPDIGADEVCSKAYLPLAVRTYQPTVLLRPDTR